MHWYYLGPEDIAKMDHGDPFLMGQNGSNVLFPYIIQPKIPVYWKCSVDFAIVLNLMIIHPEDILGFIYDIYVN